MKRIFRMALTVCLALGLLACGAGIYHVNMKNGTTYAAVGEPDYDEDSASYRFTDNNGKKVVVNKDDVQSIEQVE